MTPKPGFRGFGDSEGLTPLPDSFFRELLENVTDIGLLKVTLFTLWRLQHVDSGIRALRREELLSAELGLQKHEIEAALASAVSEGILLRAERDSQVSYLLNSPAGRASAEAISAGLNSIPGSTSTPLERPDIFGVYEANIGPLTPLIADALRDAERSFPVEWIRDAIDLAVRNNKRSWSYCEAILRRWKEEGRGTKQNRRDDPTARQRDVEEKIRKFIQG